MQKQTIRMNKRFYRKDALLTVKERFEEIAELDILEMNEYYTVTIKAVKISEKNILEEFANHCLAEGR